MQSDNGLSISTSPVVLLTARGELSDQFIALLARDFPDLVVIMEDYVSRAEVNRFRRQKFGLAYIVSERLAAVARRCVGIALRGHRKKLYAALGLTSTYHLPLFHVENVNSERAIRLLQELSPQVVAVYSTRVLRKPLLNCVTVPFINYHCGINPLYRGQFPLYWAKAMGDEANVGVTVHLIDEGIDTGDVLYQERVHFDKMDISSFQFTKALPIGARLMTQALRDALAHELKPYKVGGVSRVWYPPTLTQYLWYGIKRRVF
jgi:folate-dependent phosphoribosylglycinamide formyltransferase PurN